MILYSRLYLFAGVIFIKPIHLKINYLFKYIMQTTEFPSKIAVFNPSGSAGAKLSALRADTMKESS